MYKVLSSVISLSVTHLIRPHIRSNFLRNNHRRSVKLDNHVGCLRWQRSGGFLRPFDDKHICKLYLHFGSKMLVLSPTVSVQSESEPPKKGKVFEEFETKHHHKVLEKLSAYSNTIFKSDPYFSEKYKLSEEEYNALINIDSLENKSGYNVAASFVSLGVYSSKLNVNIDNHCFDKITSDFVDKVHSLNDDQLIDCLIALQYWPETDSIKSPNYLKVWKSLDGVCLKRQTDWSIDKSLFMMDLWYCLRLTRVTEFIYKGLNRISRKCDDLTRPQLIQTLFYMSCVRKLHPAISLRDYEYNIQKYITNLSVEEIAIFALAFFKTTTSILNKKILLYIMQRVVEEVESIPEISLAAITKEIRLSHKPEIGFTANDLVKQIVERRMNSLSLVNAIHVLHITTQMQFYNEEAITKLAELFYTNPADARLKDMERVAFVLSMFNYIPPSTPGICEMIEEQLSLPQHIEAGESHPRTLLSLVYFLTLLKTHPEKLIRQLLSEESLASLYENKFRTPVQIVQIEYNRALEGPPGSEYLLTPTLREYLARRHSLFLPDGKYKLNQFDTMFAEVLALTQDILGGEQYCLATWALPHYPRGDILFHLDDSGKPVAIPEEMRTKPQFEDVLRPPDPRGWFCVVVGGRNMFMHNVPKLAGEHVAKLRQLKLIGYTPIIIPSFYWGNEKNKREFLRLKYFNRPG